MTTPATKRCPGYDPGPSAPDSYSALPHVLPATSENFQSNAANPDGLATRCRACGNAYGKAWALRKRAVTAAEALPPGPDRVAALDAALAMPPARRATKGQRALAAPFTGAHAVAVMPDGQVVDPVAAPPAPARLAVSESAPIPTYDSELAVKARRGRVKGWAAELHAGVWYAIPTDQATIESEQGQAALAAVAAAVVTERRARDAERKRHERAAAKARAAAQA